MTDHEISDRVIRLVANHLYANLDKVTPGAAFIDDLGADSLDYVELNMAFEEEFDIEIPDDEASQIQTVGDAIKAVSDRLGVSA